MAAAFWCLWASSSAIADYLRLAASSTGQNEQIPWSSQGNSGAFLVRWGLEALNQSQQSNADQQPWLWGAGSPPPHTQMQNINSDT